MMALIFKALGVKDLTDLGHLTIFIVTAVVAAIVVLGTL